MALVKPFRAVRYDERVAGRIESLVAPPYDVIDAAARERYRAASPYNVVRLTLPDGEDEAAALWRSWLAEGALALEAEPAFWWLSQDYVGPDGVARTRRGLVCALHAEPYGRRIVLPHERTHAGPKEGRLRLLRALRAHVEPIFLLYDGVLDARDGTPLVDVELEGVRNRLWRGGSDVARALADAALLIADGHHRYETTLAFHEEDGTPESAWLLAVVVPTEQEGLTIFPTHRVVDRLGAVDGRPAATVSEALRALPDGRSAAVLYRAGSASVVEGQPGEPDTALVARLGGEGITYTPSLDEAVASVDRGDAEGAFLVRPPSIELIRTLAERGEVMPQKSTYFFPKLPSGLLFLPL